MSPQLGRFNRVKQSFVWRIRTCRREMGTQAVQSRQVSLPMERRRIATADGVSGVVLIDDQRIAEIADGGERRHPQPELVILDRPKFLAG